jgi:hypothetical protein
MAAAAGECHDSSRLFTVQFTTPFSWQYDYFDGATGAFVGRSSGASEYAAFFPCNSGYWPAPDGCLGAVVTEVIAGTRFSVGDQADTLPPAY